MISTRYKTKRRLYKDNDDIYDAPKTYLDIGHKTFRNDLWWADEHCNITVVKNDGKDSHESGYPFSGRICHTTKRISMAYHPKETSETKKRFVIRQLKNMFPEYQLTVFGD